MMLSASSLETLGLLRVFFRPILSFSQEFGEAVLDYLARSYL